VFTDSTRPDTVLSDHSSTALTFIHLADVIIHSDSHRTSCQPNHLSIVLSVSGPPGPDGDQGPPGNNKMFSSGFLLVMHSQSEIVPTCPLGLTVLWTGYSLQYMQDHKRGHTQDLGMWLIHTVTLKSACKFH